MGIAGSICYVTNSNVATVASSVRLISLEVWAPPGAGTFTTAAIEYTGTSNTADYLVTDTSNSPSYPAHVRASPPSNSQSSWWQNPNSANVIIANITAPAGSIIDAVIEWVQASDANTTGIAVSVATGVLGNFYYLPLDGTGTHRFIPVAFTSTF
jgi:hypothetical protein